MFLNAGSKDAGVDPDWDPVSRRYIGKHSVYNSNMQSGIENENNNEKKE
jgi:hypothetical protein